jgi:hypothetical protein
MLVDSKLSTYTPAFIQQPPLRLDTHARLATIPRACAPSLHYAKGRDRRRIVEIPEKSTRNANDASDKGVKFWLMRYHRNQNKLSFHLNHFSLSPVFVDG